MNFLKHIFSSWKNKNQQPEKDWRLQGQETYLKNKTFLWDHYKPPSPEWDHDHGEFCWKKFSEHPNDLHEGYTTKDQYRWICEQCYNDFKDQFHWQVTNHKNNP